MGLVFLDTSVVIALRNRNDIHHGGAVEALKNLNGEIAISVVTLSESLVHLFRLQPARAHKEATTLVESVDHLFNVDGRIAVEAACIRAEKSLALADAMISASAQLADATLWTFDAKLAKATPGSRLLV